jgi:hypothetical protein
VAKWSHMRISTIALAATAVLTACTYTYGEADPKPNVLLAHSTATLALEIDPAIQETYVVHTSTNSTLNIQQWRATLARGFRQGIAPFYAAAPDAAHAELKLVIRLATVDFDGKWRLRYQAEVLDAQGRSIKQWADTASVDPIRESFPSSVPTGPLARAVERMYEAIARDFPQTAGR